MASSLHKLKTVSNVPIKVCPFHPRKKITSVCNTCGEMFVCNLCITALHMGHKLVDTEDYLNVKKHRLNGLLKDTENKIKKVDERLDKISKVKDENSNTAKNVMMDLEKRAEEMKEEIDRIVVSYAEKCRNTEEKNVEILERVKTKLLQQLSDLQDTATMCKNALQPEKYANLANLERHMRAEISKPMKGLPVLQSPVLLYGEQEQQLLEQMKVLYGTLTSKDWVVYRKDSADDDLMSTSTKLTSKMPPIKHNLITAIASFRHPSNSRVAVVAPVMDGKAWIARGGTYEGHLMLMTGDIKQTTSVENYLSIIDIMVRSDTTKTIICCTDGSIRTILQSGKNSVMFRTKYSATSLCEVDSGNILVCHDDGKLIKYAKDGEVLQTLHKDPAGRKLFSLPTRVRVNRRTGDIAVIEDSLPRHVIVMDRRLNILHRFHGDIANNENTDNVELDMDMKKFIPSSLCFDRSNNLLIADLGSKSVLLLDRRGRNVRTVWKDGNIPTSLGVQPNGDAWVGFANGKVKIIRYLNN